MGDTTEFTLREQEARIRVMQNDAMLKLLDSIKRDQDIRFPPYSHRHRHRHRRRIVRRGDRPPPMGGLTANRGGITSSELRDALAALRWSQRGLSQRGLSQRGLAEALACDDRLVRRWPSGGATIPADIAVCLRSLSRFHQTNPPPDTWRTRRLIRTEAPHP
jgi:ribosome-binding protein aMBF1 (putative translation factor)